MNLRKAYTRESWRWFRLRLTGLLGAGGALASYFNDPEPEEEGPPNV